MEIDYVNDDCLNSIIVRLNQCIGILNENIYELNIDSTERLVELVTQCEDTICDHHPQLCAGLQRQFGVVYIANHQEYNEKIVVCIGHIQRIFQEMDISNIRSIYNDIRILGVHAMVINEYIEQHNQ